jgi:hypothetical protein
MAAALFVSIATVAVAQPPRVETARIVGVVTATSPTSLSIKQANGEVRTIGLSKTLTVINARPINIEQIKPGMYIASANTNIDANSGKSIELRMSEPSIKGAEFSRPMAQANTTMTNGTVQEVKKGAGGRELNVYVPGGVRKIIVPPDVKVIGNFPGKITDLKVGAAVNTTATKLPSGEFVSARVTVTKS